MARNPYYTAPATLPDPEQLRHLARVVVTHLQARAGEPTIPDAELRALHPMFADPRVWQAVKTVLEL